MIVEILAVRDSKAEVFSQPMFVVTVGAGIRAFADQVNDPQAPFGKHPDDYTLFHLGSFDDVKGAFLPLSTPVSLGLAAQFVTERR